MKIKKRIKLKKDLKKGIKLLKTNVVVQTKRTRTVCWLNRIF